MGDGPMALTWRQRMLGPALAGAAMGGVWCGLAQATPHRLWPVAALAGLAAGAAAGLIVYHLRRDLAVGIAGMVAWVIMAWLGFWAVPLAGLAITGSAQPLGNAIAFGGTVGGFWGLTWRLLVVTTRMRPPWRAIGIVLTFLACNLTPLQLPELMLYNPRLRVARLASCHSNLTQLARAMQLYAEDYDGRLPPSMPALQLAGFSQETLERMERDGLAYGKGALGGGPLWGYVRNGGLWYCPADPMLRDWLGRPRKDFLPDPGISYRWNAALAGKDIDDIRDRGSVPLMFDRAPFHRKGRNVVYLDGHAAHMREREWKRLHVEGR